MSKNSTRLLGTIIFTGALALFAGTSAASATAQASSLTTTGNPGGFTSVSMEAAPPTASAPSSSAKGSSVAPQAAPSLPIGCTWAIGGALATNCHQMTSSSGTITKLVNRYTSGYSDGFVSQNCNRKASFSWRNASNATRTYTMSAPGCQLGALDVVSTMSGSERSRVGSPSCSAASNDFTNKQFTAAACLSVR